MSSEVTKRVFNSCLMAPPAEFFAHPQHARARRFLQKVLDLLQRVAGAVLKTLQKEEMVARFGGDEFVAVTLCLQTGITPLLQLLSFS